MASAPPPPPLPPNEAASKSLSDNKSSSSSQPISASSRSSVRGVGRGIASSGRDGGGGGRYTTTTGGGRGGSQGPGGRGGRNYPHNNSQNNGNHQPGQPAIRPVNEVPYGYLPAFLPGASSMVEQLDRKLLVILRDGRHLVGILRTFDQYSNMVLQDTSERRILVVTKKEDGADDAPPSSNTICYQTDIELGLFIVRGDNVVLFGEVDNEEENIDGLVRFVSLDEFQQLEEVEEQRKESGGEGGSEPINWDFDTDLVA